MISRALPWMVCCSLFFGLASSAPALETETTTNWWSLRPLRSPPVPAVKTTARLRTPIDAFIAARLEAAGLSLAEEADKPTLLRRVYYDLVGLPPTPAELAEFSRDTSTNAYEKVVDRLLGSPRYGERWARHWLDLAHFAETHGHDQDRIRTNAWPYRDYLVTAFNADKPYPRFVREQIAGDVLFPDEPDATVALGFVAAGPWDESSLRDIREDTLDRQIGRYLDRDDMLTTVMQTFTSSTVQCARCHDHKFDPIPQRDYYALQAVFAGVDRGNRIYDPVPEVHRQRQKLLRLSKQAEAEDKNFLLSDASQRQVAEWEEGRARRPVQWSVLDAETFQTASTAVLTRQPDGSLLASGPRPEVDTYTVTAKVPPTGLRAIRLEVLEDPSLPKQGPGRQDNGNFHLNEFQARIFSPGATQSTALTFLLPSADFEEKGWGVGQALDGNEKTAWAIHPNVGRSHHAYFPVKDPPAPTPGATLVFTLRQTHGTGHVIGRFRLSATATLPDEGLTAIPESISQVLSNAPGSRTEPARLALARFYWKQQTAQQLARLPAPSLVYAAASDFIPDNSHKPAGAPRPVHVLKRGEILKPGELAQPGALTCISNIPARFSLADPAVEGERRAALAAWLTDPSHPLTWRSIANRIWHYHFGRGLVDTPNDFGRLGSQPSHPELLDWLAVYFRDQGGAWKPLHRLIVTSAVYRQKSSAPTGAAAAIALNLDPDNRWLSHMPRIRLDAEQVRDAILQLAGVLDLRMGGPSDMQFDLQPGPHVTPKVDYTKFNVDDGAARRRSIYRFLFRTLPDPFMDAFDCPAGDQLTPARQASVTVQQALALWNNAFVAHYAARFADRVAHEPGTLREQIAVAFQMALGHPPAPEECDDLAHYAAEHGMANLCRVLLNSNEFIFVN